MEQIIINDNGICIMIYDDKKIKLSGYVSEGVDVEVYFDSIKQMQKKLKKRIDDVDLLDLIEYEEATK